VPGSLRQRQAGVWELRVRTGRDPLSGRYGQVSRIFRGTKRDAEVALARLTLEVVDGNHHGTDQTVGFLLERWIEHLEVLGRTPKTIDGYRSLVRSRLGPGLGPMKLRKLTPAHLDTFYRALLGDGLSPMSVRHCHAALSAALRQAVKWGWVDRSPAERASPPPVRQSEVKTPTTAEISQLLHELERTDHDLASMVYAAATTGCRRGELCGLRWSDIDVEHGTLTVERAITDTSRGVEVKDPKTHRARRISLDPSTVSVLGAHRRRMDERAEQCGVQLVTDSYVWSQDPRGAEPYRPNRVTDAFRNLRNRLGLDGMDFHHLRHFAATTLAGAGVDVRTIAGRLGHANPAITLRTYAHFLEAADRQAAEVMGRLKLSAVIAQEPGIGATGSAAQSQ
jgi:integrase